MRIIQDTREQNPFQFGADVEVVVRCLKVGDYSLAGHEDLVVIERKSLSDLLGSITTGRERFVKELRQLRAFRFAALVIESDWDTVLAGAYRSQVHPNAVVGSLCAFAICYGVIPVLAKDHETAAKVTERLLANYARIIEREYKALWRAE